MTAHALNHVAATPNIPSPDGKMSHDKQLAFVQAMAKHGLSHFDAGGIAGPVVQGADANTVQNTGFVGSIGNALGLNNNFKASGAPILVGTNADQLNQAYNGAQTGLNQQQGIASTLTPGVQQGANAQSTLSNQLMAQANGQGPNPAQAQYQQNVQNLAKQQAGAIASTKGISPALQARMASEQGSAAGQNAAGQAATLAAQQQIAAQNNLQNLSANQVAQGSQAVQGVNNAQQNEQNILQGVNTAANNTLTGMQSNINNVNSNVAAGNQQQAGNIFSGLGGLASQIPVIGSLFSEGGMVEAPKKMADGGLMTAPTAAPQSYVGQWLNSSPEVSGPNIPATPAQAPITIPSSKKKDSGGGGGLGIAGGGEMSDVMAGGAGDAAGGLPLADLAMLAAKGGTVQPKDKNQKAVVAGDNLKNDKIPALLSEGEVVMDRETLADKGHIGDMARAVASHIAHRNKMKGKK